MTNRERYLQTLAELKAIGEVILKESEAKDEIDLFTEEVDVMNTHLECAQLILSR